jgi:hypothetical protein
MTKDEFFNLFININSIVDLAMMKSLTELGSMSNEELEAEYAAELESAGIDPNKPIEITEYVLTESDLAAESKAATIYQMSQGKSAEEIDYLTANFEECAEKYFIKKINQHNASMFDQMKKQQEQDALGTTQDIQEEQVEDDLDDLAALMPDINEYMIEVNGSKDMITERVESAFSKFDINSIQSHFNQLNQTHTDTKPLLVVLTGDEIESWVDLYIEEDKDLHEIIINVQQLELVEF